MSELRFQIEDGIGRIWVDRPQVLNALSREIIDDLDVLLDEIKDNKNVKVLIVGGGGKFCRWRRYQWNGGVQSRRSKGFCLQHNV